MFPTVNSEFSHQVIIVTLLLLFYRRELFVQRQLWTTDLLSLACSAMISNEGMLKTKITKLIFSLGICTNIVNTLSEAEGRDDTCESFFGAHFNFIHFLSIFQNCPGKFFKILQNSTIFHRITKIFINYRTFIFIFPLF